MRMVEKTFGETWNAISDILSDLASSDNEDNGEDQEDEIATALGKLSTDDKPCWVMGTISL
jgi:hypothetical protein